MKTSIRTTYNNQFTHKKYQAFLDEIYAAHQHVPNFRIAETPIFIDKNLKEQLFEACNEISATLCRDDFKSQTAQSLLPKYSVPNEDDHTLFLQMYFGICQDKNGNLSPQLIEIQGFPSLYFFQNLLANSYKNHFEIPENYKHLFAGLTSESYLEMLRKNIVGDCPPEQVVLLEVEPHQQVTQIDFWEAAHQLGIAIKCVSELKKEGKKVFYFNDKGEKIRVKKIFNRVIFDELVNYSDLQREFIFTEEADVEWIGHPNWFFRISKYTLPLLDSKYVPETHFLKDVNHKELDLDDYVLKPLYSFAGSGVIINLNKYDIDAIDDPENYILQKKVEYAPVVETPNVPAKCEIRMLMIWEKDAAHPRIINNLARLSKGLMVGVKYNKDKDWVGASVAFFEE